MPTETNASLSINLTQSPFNILQEPNQTSAILCVSLDQTNIIDYFYTAILKYVVTEIHEIPPDATEDSDDEPSYNTEPSKQETESKISEPIFPTSSSKLIQSYNRLKLSRTAVRASLPDRTSIQKYIQIKSDKLKVNQSKKSLTNSVKTKRTTVVSLHIPEQAITAIKREPSVSKSDDGFSNYSWFDEPNCGSKRISIKFTTGVVYCGEVVNHRFHGKGVYTWPNGVFYAGDFQEGRSTGYGKLTFNDLSYYQGTFVNCILEGTGIFCPSNSPLTYTGSWSNGVPHGKGCLSYSETERYDGNWEYGQKHGRGTRMYSNSAVYSGQWVKGEPNGQGSMVFANKDFYQGEWSCGKPHGQGVYTWSAELHKGMTFSIAKQYKGHFANGLRDGYGEQVFGMEGSKTVSQFDSNMKSGAGIVVCGDGSTIEKKPLFLMDNAVGRKSGKECSSAVSVTKKKLASSKAKVSFSALKLKNVSNCTLADKTRITETFPSIDTSGIPLCLPLHATAMDISLEYHVKRLIEYSKYHQVDTVPHVTTSGVYYLPKRTRDKSRKDKGKLSFQRDAVSSSYHDNEKRLLSRAIANSFVFLKKIYHKYATLNQLHSCCPEYRNPCLNRLRLWQFLRDIKLSTYKLSLIDVDNMLLDVPDIHLETEHHPFEPIYFWQFMHCLLMLSFIWYTHNKTGLSEAPLKIQSKYNDIFKNFIEKVIKPNEGIFQGRALFTFADFLPINQVYELYGKIGEPHSARFLLNRICNKKGEAPLDCLVKTKQFCEMPAPKKHFVIGGSTIVYLTEENKNPWEMEAKSVRIQQNDAFYMDIKVFRVLGPKKVVQCIAQVCENVMDEKDLVNMEYQITCLEFYEILLNLAEELSKFRKRRAEREMEVKKSEEHVVEAEVVVVKPVGGKKKGKKRKSA